MRIRLCFMIYSFSVVVLIGLPLARSAVPERYEVFHPAFPRAASTCDDSGLENGREVRERSFGREGLVITINMEIYVLTILNDEELFLAAFGAK